jgi:hypothetical protein
MPTFEQVKQVVSFIDATCYFFHFSILQKIIKDAGCQHPDHDK